MTELPNKALLRVDEVAEYFRVVEKTIRDWIDKGNLTAVRPGGRRFLIHRESVVRYIDSSKHDPESRYGV